MTEKQVTPVLTCAIEISKKNKTKNKRGTWKSKTEFILSCLGYAIGIGNVWRFPYLCYRSGGGAFLVPYLLMLFLCGIPLFFMEMCIGQFASTGCLTMFRMTPLLKGAGYAIVIVNLICSIYYNVIITYPLLILVSTFRTVLPWESCNNSWNTEKCFHIGSNWTTIDQNLTIVERDFKTPADEFFHNGILKISNGLSEAGGIVWPLFIGNTVSWIIVALCLWKGVKTMGKVVYVTATFPFVILFILFIRGITLPGAVEGIKFYIFPRWNQLLNLKVWTDAAIQIFFSLGPGWGGIVNMASYNQFRNNSKMDSIFVPIVNCATSIFAGFVVFSVLGFLSHSTGIPVSTVATGGPGLAFVTYPEAISRMTFPHIWATLFFIMLYLLGIDSMFVQVEAVLQAIMDEVPKLRRHKYLFQIFIFLFFYLLSIPFVMNNGMYLVQLFDWYSASISVILVCFVEVIMISRTYGLDKFVRDVEFMIGTKIEIIWKISWKYVTPVILLFIFFTTIIFNTEISYNKKSYPRWGLYLGWGSCALSIICIPIYMIYKISTLKGSLRQRIATSLRPTNWRPLLEEDQREWETFIASNKN